MVTKRLSQTKFPHNKTVMSSIEIFRHFRPDWNLYFMKIAQIVKTRSNCMKRSVGAVVVKDFRLLSSGYNGTPVGFTNCFEGGCNRCNTNKVMNHSFNARVKALTFINVFAFTRRKVLCWKRVYTI